MRERPTDCLICGCEFYAHNPDSGECHFGRIDCECMQYIPKEVKRSTSRLRGLIRFLFGKKTTNRSEQ